VEQASHRGRRFRLAAAALSLVLVAGACGNKKDEGSDGTTATTAGGAAPTTATAPDGSTVAPSDLTTTLPPPDSTQAPDVQATPGGSLKIAGEAEVGAPWTPANVQCDSYCQMRIRTVIEPLVVLDENLEPQPFLAEAITPNADFTVWDITVREGISFSDGTPLNADAVIYNLQDIWTGFLVAPAMIDIARVGGDRAAPAMIDKVDEMTLRVTTGTNGDPSQPASWPQFPYFLAGQAGFIASPTWLQAVKDGTAEATAMVGTGAFTMQEYKPGDSMTVVRNPTYWLKAPNGDQLPYLDEIQFYVINDALKLADALRTGTVDLIATSDGSNINSFAGDDEFPTEVQAQYGETAYIMFHVTQPGLDDRRVRCALNQAVDKQALIDTVYGGGLDVANGPFSPGQEGYLADNGALPYDPEAAKALIDEYVAETGETPTIKYSTTVDSNNLLRAQFLQEAWEGIGVNVEVSQVEQSVFINNALVGSPDFGAFGWRQHAGIYVDTQNYWWNGRSGAPDGQLSLNFARINDPVINELLDTQRAETDPNVRRGYAEEINRQFAKECWILPLWFTKWGIIHTTDVQGIGTSPQASGEGILRDGAGFPGQVWLQGVFKAS
jgi:peptide/nickel transport system substrate-binding protein